MLASKSTFAAYYTRQICMGLADVSMLAKIANLLLSVNPADVSMLASKIKKLIFCSLLYKANSYGASGC